MNGLVHFRGALPGYLKGRFQLVGGLNEDRRKSGESQFNRSLKAICIQLYLVSYFGFVFFDSYVYFFSVFESL